MSGKPHTKQRSRADRILIFVIAVAAAVRLASLGMYPLMDSTEARYAEIARRMVDDGDWVTPRIDDGRPFWGKPPLSIWVTAASFKALGVSAFAARLPHWLCGCLLAWILGNWFARRSRREAIDALALLSGSVLFFVAAGAVMTDLVLALGMTLTMRGFWLALHGDPSGRSREQQMIFLGFAIGLLAKGPIAAVLAGMPIAIWTLSAGHVRRVLREISWGRGLLMILALVVPWYALAEWRTPGFFEYFFIGEHWQRYTDPGWSGDFYGSAHAFPRGSIWLFAVAACLPWSLLLSVAACKWGRLADPPTPGDRSLCGYLLLWALTPCVFFSLAGNILWTYVLPGLPAAAMAMALWLARIPRRAVMDRLLAGGAGITVLAYVAVVIGIQLGGWGERTSTKALISDYEAHRSDGEALVFFRKRPFSGAFYSEGRAETARNVGDLRSRLDQGPIFVAIDASHLERVPDALLSQFRLVSRRGDYRLYLATQESRDVMAPVGPPLQLTARPGFR